MTAVAKRKPKYAGPPVIKVEAWGEMGPAMRALPNDKWRKFCLYLCNGPVNSAGNTKYVDALRASGLAQDSDADNQKRHAWQLAHDNRLIAAVLEESRRYLRGLSPVAVNAMEAIIANPGHRDHGRILTWLGDRLDPVVSKQTIEVTHRHVDPDQEALEEIRALRQLGASREKLIELFGENALPRLERLEAADTAKRAEQAKVISGDYEVVND
jgi:hypothetical protein